MCAKLLQSCLTLWNPMDCSLTGSSVHGILQARILEWVAMPSSRGSSQPRDKTRVSYISHIAGRVFTLSHQGSPLSISATRSPGNMGVRAGQWGNGTPPTFLFRFHKHFFDPENCVKRKECIQCGIPPFTVCTPAWPWKPADLRLAD